MRVRIVLVVVALTRGWMVERDGRAAELSMSFRLSVQVQ